MQYKVRKSKKYRIDAPFISQTQSLQINIALVFAKKLNRHLHMELRAYQTSLEKETYIYVIMHINVDLMLI